jgi:hypothetical protein
MKRVLDLPEQGTLLVSTDIQGNLRDFHRVVSIFEETREVDPDTVLVFTGDLVHGPEIEPDAWPEHLGSFYHGDSTTVLDEAFLLSEKYPNHVHYLLGNHEHAHIGGPIVGKFFLDEAARLEQIMGADRTARMNEWMETWPLVAIAAAARIVLLHAAPHAAIRSRRDIDELSLDSLRDLSPLDVPSRTILGALLWARSTSRARAKAFLRALGDDLTTTIFGHDVVREGYAVDDPHRLCVSTSFGCFDGDKVYVKWDLADPAASAHDVATRGLHRLWPDEPAVYLEPSLRLGSKPPCK